MESQDFHAEAEKFTQAIKAYNPYNNTPLTAEGFAEALVLAETGDAFNANLVGRALFNGEAGQQADHQQARIWFEKAAAADLPQALYNLVNLYYLPSKDDAREASDTDVTPEDVTTGFTILERLAAEFDYPPAMFLLSVAIGHYPEAAAQHELSEDIQWQLLFDAAAAGFTPAMIDLARQLVSIAANDGNPVAQRYADAMQAEFKFMKSATLRAKFMARLNHIRENVKLPPLHKWTGSEGWQEHDPT